MAAKNKSQSKEKISILNSVGDNELYVYGYIGPWQEVDWQPFLNAFKPMDYAGNEVTIHVNCYGGDTFSGLTIFDQLKNAQAIVSFIVEGVAASMGGVLIQCASKGKRFITRNSRIMIHKVSSYKEGEAEDLLDHAKLLQDEDKKLNTIFKESTGQPKKVVDKWFTRGSMTWFTAEEALEAGLVDEIIQHEDEKVPATENLSAKSPEEVWGIFNQIKPPVANNNSTHNQNSDMNKFKMAILAVLVQAGIKVTPNETDSDEKWVEALNSAVTQISNSATEATNALNNILAERATELIENAIAAGKIRKDIDATTKATFIKNATEGYAVVKNMLDMVVVSNETNEDEEEDPSGEKGKGADLQNFLTSGKAVKQPASKNAIPDERKTWDITKWAKEDPEGLRALETNNKVAYQALLNKVEKELISNGVKITE